jgi:hypothetical protein
MRSSRRPVGSPRKRAVPARSRLTVRAPAFAPLSRGVGLRDALQASREALADVQAQLDALLNAVRKGSSSPAVENDAAGAMKTASVDRLAGATRRASLAIRSLSKA